MIEQRARVTRVEGRAVWIQAEPQSSCHSCEVKSGCGSGLLAQYFPARFNQAQCLPLPPGAEVPLPGDAVIVGVDEAHLQKASLLLYALPLVALLAGAVAGQMLGGSELASIAVGLSGLGAALYLIRKWGVALLGLSGGGLRLLRIEHSRPGVRLDSVGMRTADS